MVELGSHANRTERHSRGADGVGESGSTHTLQVCKVLEEAEWGPGREWVY